MIVGSKLVVRRRGFVHCCGPFKCGLSCECGPIIGINFLIGTERNQPYKGKITYYLPSSLIRAAKLTFGKPEKE